MTRYIIVWLIGSLFAYYLANSGSPLLAQTAVNPAPTARSLNPKSNPSNPLVSEPVITIAGLCDHSSGDNTETSDCKTVITRAQFDKLIDAIQPNMPMRTRREFALRYADALIMANKAEQLGLDKKANYEEQLKLARIEALSQDLKKVIQENAFQISEKEIEEYYHENIARFEKVQVDRIYVPRNRQPQLTAEKTPIVSDMEKRSLDPEKTLRNEADTLRARAVAGEEFNNLQADAYRVAGITSTPPITRMIVRRTSFPPNQALVMDLKPSEISSVLSDPNGYVIYRLNSKEIIPLDQTSEEIKATLRSQHMQNAMRSILGTNGPVLNESYFAR